MKEFGGRNSQHRKELVRLEVELLSRLAHNIRTPLTTLKQAVDNLLEGILGPLLPEQLRVVAVARQHIDRMVKALGESFAEGGPEAPNPTKKALQRTKTHRSSRHH